MPSKVEYNGFFKKKKRHLSPHLPYVKTGDAEMQAQIYKTELKMSKGSQLST